VPFAVYAAASNVCVVSAMDQPCLRTSTIPFRGPATAPRT